MSAYQRTVIIITGKVLIIPKLPECTVRIRMTAQLLLVSVAGNVHILSLYLRPATTYGNRLSGSLGSHFL